MRNIKMLGLLAVSAMALVAFVGTSSAMAAEEFHATAENASLKGLQNGTHVFKVQGNETTCKKAEFTGTGTTKTTSTQKVHPTYSECTAFGFGATIDTEGCQYAFTSKTSSGKATVNLQECTKGFVTILVNIPFVARCHVVVGNQTNINNIDYDTNKNTVLQVGAESTNIEYEVKESKLACPLEVKSGNNATYTGLTNVEANGGADELWWE